jgi:hypothetical protein
MLQITSAFGRATRLCLMLLLKLKPTMHQASSFGVLDLAVPSRGRLKLLLLKLMMKKLTLSLAVLAFLAPFTPSAFAAPDDTDLGFETAFYRPFYKTSSFGLVVTGSAIVAAGTFTYFTAGAGAPAAATGVSTVASWVAGGGAGSYMAGLSTIGGWFGGNAMLGAAILNGISLGTVGGMGSWGALSAGQKALALGATAATAMDGIAIISKPDTQQLEWRVVLPVPLDLADDRTRTLLDALSEANKESNASASELEVAKAEDQDQAPGSPKSKKLLQAERALAAANARHKVATDQVNDELARVLKLGDSNRTTVLMAVIAQNSGRSADFRTLLGRIDLAPLKRRSYLDYLRAIAALQAGTVTEASRLLHESWNAANFAIEPPILLAGVVGSRSFAAQESKIQEIASFADKNFKPNAYMTSASLVSLHYRIGTMALGANRCDSALAAFTKAQAELSTIAKYWSGKDIRNLLEIGEANALHCQGKKLEAHEIFKEVWERTSGKDARELLCVQYSGGCAR